MIGEEVPSDQYYWAPLASTDEGVWRAWTACAGPGPRPQLETARAARGDRHAGLPPGCRQVQARLQLPNTSATATTR